MKTRSTLYALVVLLGIAALLAPSAPAQNSSTTIKATLVRYWDLEGAAADDDIIIAAANVVDSTSYTIAAQPDEPRPLVGKTVGDNSCIADLVGTLADGTQVTSTLTWTVAAATITPSPNYNFATVISFTTRVCTGEAGGETIQLGTATASWVYPFSYGRKLQDSQGRNQADPFYWRELAVPIKVETSGSSTTVAASTAGTHPYDLIAVGDILQLHYKSDHFERGVTARASADSITVDSAVDLGTDGNYFRYKKLMVGADSEDSWIGVGNMASIRYTINIIQMNGTGGIDSKVECRLAQGTPVVLIGTTNTAAAGVVDDALDFETAGPFDQCRLGMMWHTNDDGTDTTTAQEQITIQFSGQLRQGR